MNKIIVVFAAFFLLLMNFAFGDDEMLVNSLIKKYAEEKKLNIIFPETKMETSSNKIKLNLSWDKKNDQEKMEILHKILGEYDQGFFIQGDDLTLFNLRDVRFKSLPSYKSSEYPKTNGHIEVLHTMKYPIAKEIMRSTRSIFSRYGRIMSLADEKSLLIIEKGVLVHNILELIDVGDSAENYQKIMEKRKNHKPEEEKSAAESKESKEGEKHE